MKLRLLTPLLSSAALLFGAAACSESEAGTVAEQSARGPVTDADIAPWRVDLLDLAFSAASEFPLDPHVKNRSRLQEAVVAACFELDRPHHALRHVDRIANWRRGAGYADYAAYLIDHGDTEDVERWLERAITIAREHAQQETAQEWRHDVIRAKVGRAWLALGNRAEAAKHLTGLSDVAAATVAADVAASVSDEEFDRQVEAIDDVFENGGLEQVRGALAACARAFDRYYDDAERRVAMRDRVATAYDKLPVSIRIELLGELARTAVRHGDRDRALALVDRADALASGERWLPEDEVPLVARLAALRYRAGDEVAAREAVDRALAKYDETEARIVDVFRAAALRPVAEAYEVMGDAQTALAVYARVLEAGVQNPNSRPRADDLAATCISMAVHGTEPSAELRARMQEIHDALGHPW